MARVTVEDCLENVKNRFELVMIASKRARQLMRGSAEPKVAWENDKATVVALREIAMGYTDFSDAHHVDIVPQAPQEEAVVISMDLDDDEDDEIIIIEENSIDTTDTTPSAGSNDPEQIDPLDDNPPHEASITGTSSQSK